MRRIVLVALIGGAALSGCARDPLRDVPRLSEVGQAQPGVEDAALTAALQANLVEQSPAQSVGLGGFFSSLFSPNQAPAAATPEDAARAATTEPEAAEPEATQAAATPAPRGFFARLFGGNSDEAIPAAAGDPRPGLLPRACNLSRSERGRRVEARAGFTLYDSFPQSTAPRRFYVTGFSDGCARVITAALVMFGDSGAYQTRELYAGRNRQPDRFDQSFERLKSRICRVSASQPCGSRQARFESSVAMLTAYDRFETSPTLTNILLHDRSVVALSR